MNINDLDKLNERALAILREYNELKLEIHSLLKEENKSMSRIRGAISSAGVATEKILLYIISKSGRDNKLESLKSNQKRGIYEYKKIVEDIVPRTQMIHIGTITPFRNDVNHPSEGHFDADELRAVEIAINSLTKWFFETYLKGEYADFSKNMYTKNEPAKDLSQKEPGAIKKKFDKNAFNIPDYSILQKSKKFKKKSKAPARIITIVLLFVICFGFYKIYQNYQNKQHEEKALFYLERYLNSSNLSEFNPYDYFADRVDVYITHKNITPDSIFKIRNKNEDYVERHYKILEGSMKFHKDSSGVSYWRFINDFRCKMPNNPPEKRYWSAKVMTEIGYDPNYKITRYKEIHPLISRQWSREKSY
jgi:hypothetical protein